MERAVSRALKARNRVALASLAEIPLEGMNVSGDEPGVHAYRPAASGCMPRIVKPSAFLLVPTASLDASFDRPGQIPLQEAMRAGIH